MKVRATTCFAGEVCMAAGEVRDVSERVAAPLLECGYLESVKTPEQKRAPQREADDTADQGQEPEQPSEKSKRSPSKGAKTGD